MTKGSKVKGRLAARQAAYKSKGDGSTHRPGSFKKSFPKAASRGSRNRSHTA